MTTFIGTVISGLIVSAVSGLVGYLVSRRYHEPFIPGKKPPIPAGGYTHLSKTWHMYYLSCNPFGKELSNPVWTHATEELKVRGYRVEGRRWIRDYPECKLDYRIRGEIRHGRMILTDICSQDETDFAVICYADLWSNRALVGIYTSFSGGGKPVAFPVVLSEDAVISEDLNRLTREYWKDRVCWPADCELLVGPKRSD